MSFFDRILGREPNPTQKWPIVELSHPDIDLEDICLGSLRFGDPLASAQCLGRPDVFRGTENGYCELLYARSGFQIDFDASSFVYLAFFIAPDKETATLPGLAFSQPHINGAGSLTSNITETQITGWLGSPGDEERDGNETVLFYPQGEVTMEFEMNSDGCLKRWNLYPQKGRI